jgi:hypothetical protein
MAGSEEWIRHPELVEGSAPGRQSQHSQDEKRTGMTIAELFKDLKMAYAKASFDCGEGLRPPATDEAIDQIELQLGMSVPNELRSVLRIHGGQKPIGGVGVNTGFFGKHLLLSPQEIVENHRMYSTHCLLDPLPEFPPKPGDWGYWIPELIPFASWDSYDLCIHSNRGDVWEFCPNFGLTAHRPSIVAVLRELKDVVNAGMEPALLKKGTEQNLRGDE